MIRTCVPGASSVTNAVMPSAVRVGMRITPSSARNRETGVAMRLAVPGIPSPTRPSRHCEVASLPPASKLAGYEYLRQIR
ncbi:hypothetical protein D3C81_1651340 [compost metagenome]